MQDLYKNARTIRQNNKKCNRKSIQIYTKSQELSVETKKMQSKINTDLYKNARTIRRNNKKCNRKSIQI
jgi:hypothetical protein